MSPHYYIIVAHHGNGQIGSGDENHDSHIYIHTYTHTQKNRRLNFIQKELSMKLMVALSNAVHQMFGAKKKIFRFFSILFLAARAWFSGGEVLVSRDAAKIARFTLFKRA